MSFAVTYADQDWFVFAGNEHVLFFVDCDTIFREDGDGAVVRFFAHAHYRAGEVVECVGTCRLIG